MRNGVPTQYFAGSLADFAVFNSGSAPANLATPTTQTQIDTFATRSATGYWKLVDTGTTTVPRGTTLPVIGTTAPCSYVDITWGTHQPDLVRGRTAVDHERLHDDDHEAVGVRWRPGSRQVGTVAPGTTQTFTLALAQDASYTGTASRPSCRD